MNARILSNDAFASILASTDIEARINGIVSNNRF